MRARAVGGLFVSERVGGVGADDAAQEGDFAPGARAFYVKNDGVSSKKYAGVKVMQWDVVINLGALFRWEACSWAV